MEAKLLRRSVIAEETVEVTLEIPDKDFIFSAGQYSTISIPGLEDASPPDRFHDFSISSSPDELPELSTTMRLSKSVFKTKLMSLPLGASLTVEAPKGVFTLPKSGGELVFIAGGIGITPFMSMIRYSLGHKFPGRITLFYYNRSPESSAYLEELRNLSEKHQSFNLVSVFGDLKGNELKKHIIKEKTDEWYIAGPPGMVFAARQILKDNGIDDVIIKTEEFAGYE